MAAILKADHNLLLPPMNSVQHGCYFESRPHLVTQGLGAWAVSLLIQSSSGTLTGLLVDGLVVAHQPR